MNSLTKELLSEVYKFKPIISENEELKSLNSIRKSFWDSWCEGIRSGEYHFRIEGNTFLSFDDEGQSSKEFNIHELAHKCKEWAFKNKYAFKIEFLGIKDINIQLINHDTEKVAYSKDFYNIKGIEDTVIPCEWILENKDA